MGGGRCFFHDCRQRNDGVTHMFRFPVFDKVRCYSWLVATGRMDFLKLKVSQVRNKQICQYHFPDDDFMNAMKNSLKPSVIPTLAGPFCLSMSHDEDDMSLTRDQIENEVLAPRDLKQESLNLKLYDFLTSSEAEGFSSVTTIKLEKEVTQSDNVISIQSPLKMQGNKQLPINKLFPLAAMGKALAPKKLSTSKTIAPKSINVHDIIQDFDEKPNEKPMKNPIILSEEKVTLTSNLMPKTPIILSGLRRVNPMSHVIGNKETNNILRDDSEQFVRENKNPNSLLKQGVTGDSDKVLLKPVLSEQDGRTLEVTEKPKVLIPYSPGLVELEIPHLAPEDKNKSSIIQEKRTFNRRLKDIIRESIDMADSRSPKEDKNTDQKPKEDQVPAHLIKEKDTSSIEAMVAISQLQNRLKTMEVLLLNRIDANTKEVFDLKRILEERHKEEKKKEHQAKLETSEEERKKRLFNEISEYLSKESKSALYEQLFISKYPKRRKK